MFRKVWKCGGDGDNSHAHHCIPVRFTKRRNVTFYTYIPYNLYGCSCAAAGFSVTKRSLANVRCVPEIEKKNYYIYGNPFTFGAKCLHALWLFYENDRWMSTTFRWYLSRIIISNKQIFFQIIIQSPFQITINRTLSVKLFNETVHILNSTILKRVFDICCICPNVLRQTINFNSVKYISHVSVRFCSNCFDVNAISYYFLKHNLI